MTDENWDRDVNGELIPNKGEVKIFDKPLSKQIEIEKLKLEQETDEKNKAVRIRAIELLEDSFKEGTSKHQITYLPLIHAELSYVRRKFGCNGKYVLDIEADICSTKCLHPKKSYAQWRDMKDPKLKIEFADFIFKNSIPERKKSEKEVKAFQMLQRLV